MNIFYLLSLFLCVVTCLDHGLPSPTEHQGLHAQSTRDNVEAPAPTEPVPQELVRRILEKRALTNVCGYFGYTDPWTCASNSYCVYDYGQYFKCCSFSNGALAGDCANTAYCYNYLSVSKYCGNSTTCGTATLQCASGTNTLCQAYYLSAFPQDTQTYINYRCGTTSAIFLGLIDSQVVRASSRSSTSSLSSTPVSLGSSGLQSSSVPASSEGASSGASSSTSSGTGHLSTGAIVGIAVGCAIGGIIVAAALVFVCYRTKQKKKERKHGDVPIMTGEVSEPFRKPL